MYIWDVLSFFNSREKQKYATKWLQYDQDRSSKQCKMRWCLNLLKETLGACVVILSNLSKYIFCEASIQSNKGYNGAVYRSSSQHANECQNLLLNFETILNDSTTNNALFIIILGNFNATSSTWWTDGKITTEGTKHKSLTTGHEFHHSYHSSLV